MCLAAAAGCGAETDWQCEIVGDVPDFVQQIGCKADFESLASVPANASIPGARSTKIVIDRIDGDALYFQNSTRYAVHHAFASAHLSVSSGRPLVPAISEFNQTQYTSPERRFLLGAVTYYEGPGVWVYEIAPYDTASADMIATAYDAISAAMFIGTGLRVHPTSDNVALEVAKLPSRIPVITTEQLFAGIDYQPLNLATSLGRLAFVRADDLGTAYVGFRDIVVLDRVPNDISVVSGIITEAFQTPLSHINVLSQNRGTPNMGLRGAFDRAELRALDGQWVRLEVGPFGWKIEAVSEAAADAWWEANRPPAVRVPGLDLSVTALLDVENMLDASAPSLLASIDRSIPAFGGKASHYAALAAVGDEVPVPKAFAIPVYYYNQFMVQNGFDVQVAALLADETFKRDSAVRDEKLRLLREAMKVAPVDKDFEAMLMDKLARDYPGVRMRFRSSTNAEDLDGFTGAGLYTSKSGQPGDPQRPVLDAVRKVWASIWFFRAFEERVYRGIDHTAVGMALLVHRSFPDEEANGVALTANIFDRLCVEPGFYVNVQVGEASVVKPDPGVTTEQFIYHFDFAGQPIVYLTRSSLVPAGQIVLTREQVFALGRALSSIHNYFSVAYAPPAGAPLCETFYAMDVEFKFDGPPGQTPELFIKQARPHPGWGL